MAIHRTAFAVALVWCGCTGIAGENIPLESNEDPRTGAGGGWKFDRRCWGAGGDTGGDGGSSARYDDHHGPQVAQAEPAQRAEWLGGATGGTGRRNRRHRQTLVERAAPAETLVERRLDRWSGWSDRRNRRRNGRNGRRQRAAPAERAQRAALAERVAQRAEPAERVAQRAEPAEPAAQRVEPAAPVEPAAAPVEPAAGGTGMCSLSVTVTTASTGGQFAPRNIGAIWITNSSGAFVKTLAKWAAVRQQYLTAWNASSKANVVDAVTSATLSSHQTHKVTWNCTDASKAQVADGAYKVNFELTDKDATGPNYSAAFTKGPTGATVTPADASSFKSISVVFTP